MMTRIDLYSFITIVTIVTLAVTSLSIWYWSGRRPSKDNY
ncbi:hypothetical protein SAMN02910293_01505 [Streptococcus henryi]|uniref:Uncharacterized protein n=1 Tax=Streptococcus henryi TaxID=439219 RepID=A0A1G6CBK5_9STRE|nr:hypothetical protein SAMN02910293_01505 [Streptococcus henryi]